MRYSQEHPLATQLETRDRNLLGFGSLIKQDPNLNPTSLPRDLVPQETHTYPNEKSVRERARARGVPKVRKRAGREEEKDEVTATLVLPL